MARQYDANGDRYLNIFRACAAKGRDGALPMPPYQFICVEDTGYEGMSECDLCGQEIRYEFWFGGRGGDFKLGSDCGPKLLAQIEDLAHRRQFTDQLALAKSAKSRLTRLQRLHKRITGGQVKPKDILLFAGEALALQTHLLTDQPHPKLAGLTLRDYVQWVLAQPTCRRVTKLAAAQHVISAWGGVRHIVSWAEQQRIIAEMQRETL